MKYSLFIMCLLLNVPVLGQAEKDSIATKNELESIKYNLGKYHSERRTGYALAGLAVVFAGVGAVTSMNADPLSDNTLVRNMYIISGSLSIISVVTFYSSEKWLKRASLSISPTALRVTF